LTLKNESDILVWRSKESERKLNVLLDKH